MDVLLRTVDNEKTNKNFFVLCSLSKYTLLIDQGKAHAKIVIQNLSKKCHDDNYKAIFKLAPRSWTGLLQLLRVRPSFLPSVSTIYQVSIGFI